jgi:hypothetical protein
LPHVAILGRTRMSSPQTRHCLPMGQSRSMFGEVLVANHSSNSRYLWEVIYCNSTRSRRDLTGPSKNSSLVRHSCNPVDGHRRIDGNPFPLSRVSLTLYRPLITLAHITACAAAVNLWHPVVDPCQKSESDGSGIRSAWRLVHTLALSCCAWSLS